MPDKRILVVEDESSLRKAISVSLRKHQYEVLMATSADEAINALSANGHVDAIWLDHYLLNNETGLDFLKKMKTQDSWKNIPVFVVSNSVDDTKVSSYYVMGIEKYYIKAENSLDTIIVDINNHFKKDGINE
ncbi:MAG: response regulator [Patescibacteria group bacterium]|jgi:CheY-like chemotaxis protein|nr:response regulator [Patescibacteria group bacterium]